jgi:hypothetical protein
MALCFLGVQGTEEVVAVEDFFGEVERTVVVMVGSFEADGGILTGNVVEANGYLDLVPGDLFHLLDDGGDFLRVIGAKSANAKPTDNEESANDAPIGTCG